MGQDGSLNTQHDGVVRKNLVADFYTIAVKLRTRARCSLDTWEFFEKPIHIYTQRVTRILMSSLKFGLLVKMDQSTLHGGILQSAPPNNELF